MPGPPQQLLEADATTDIYGHPSWLASCSSIFLDVGSNIGVQVRKVFEPEKYPAAKLLPAFSKFLGMPEERRRAADVSGICALGLEPNPSHRERLDRLAESYAERGWRVHFYPFAAWAAEGFMALNTTANRASPGDTSGLGVHLQFGNHGGSLAPDTSAHVRTVNLADFIHSLPAGSVRLMKMDIEGAEWETLAELLKQDVLCDSSVQSAFIETHPWGETTHWGDRSAFKAHPRSFPAVQEQMRRFAASARCPAGVTRVSVLDDESYPHDVDEEFRGTTGHPAAAAQTDDVWALATGVGKFDLSPSARSKPSTVMPQGRGSAPDNAERHVDTVSYAIKGGQVIRVGA